MSIFKIFMPVWKECVFCSCWCHVLCVSVNSRYLIVLFKFIYIYLFDLSVTKRGILLNTYQLRIVLSSLLSFLINVYNDSISYNVFALKSILPISIVVLTLYFPWTHFSTLLNTIHSVWLYFRCVSHVIGLLVYFRWLFTEEKFTYSEMHRSFNFIKK